jgi:hypothetical protein
MALDYCDSGAISIDCSAFLPEEAMLKNYLTTTLRKLSRQRSYTAISVFGLALGVTSSLMLFLLIKFELSFDSFHRKADRINEPALGKKIRLDNKLDLKIAGILRDFPTNTDFPFKLLVSLVTLKELGRDLQSWSNTASNVQTFVLLSENIFAYSFLDDTIAEFYRGEARIAQLFRLFAAIAILIGCLGLFGLMALAIAGLTVSWQSIKAALANPVEALRYE